MPSDPPTIPYYQRPPQYYQRRFDLLIFPAIVVNVYYIFFLIVAYNLPMIINIKYPWYTPVFAQFFLLLVTFFLGYMGIREPRDRTPDRRRSLVSLVSLVICTSLFIASIALPMFFWGGSHRSWFSPLLVAVSGLAVLISKSTPVRLILAGVGIVLFGVLSFVYNDIDLNPDVVLDIVFLHPTGVELYSFLQTLSAIVAIMVTVYLSWNTEITIFGD